MTSILSRLEELLTAENYEEALATCENYAEEDPKVLQVRLYCLVVMGRWDDILEVTSSADTTMADHGATDPFAFERGLALYRKADLTGAELIFDHWRSAQDPEEKLPNRSMLHLGAQIKYRQGKVFAALTLYRRLVEAEEGEPDVLLRANLVAAQVAAQASCNIRLRNGTEAKGGDVLGKTWMKTLEPLSMKCGELAYNLSLSAFNSGDVETASDFLDAAERHFRDEALDSGEAEAVEWHRDVVLMRLQRALIWEKMGRVTEASETYQEIIAKAEDEKVEPATHLIAACNLSVLKNDLSILSAALSKTAAVGYTKILTPLQSTSLEINKAHLLFATGKDLDARRAVHNARSAHPDDGQVVLLRAWELIREGRLQRCRIMLSEVLAKAENNPTAYLPTLNMLRLLRAELYLRHKQVPVALRTLEPIPDEVLFRNRELLRAKVVLLQLIKKSDDAVALLEGAAMYWKDSQHEDATDAYREIQIAIGWVQSERGSFLEGAERFREVLANCAFDVRALIGLGTATAREICEATEPREALKEDLSSIVSKVSSNLPWLDKQTDPRKLEESAFPTYLSGDVAPKTKKRKPRYGANFDPENPGPLPDPERWIKKSERAAFKKKQNKKKPGQRNDRAAVRVNRNAQGAMPTEKGPTTTGPSTASVTVAKEKRVRRR